MFGEVEEHKFLKSGGEGKGSNWITTPTKSYNVSSECLWLEGCPWNPNLNL